MSILCAVMAAAGNAMANVLQRKASLEQAPDLRFGTRPAVGPGGSVQSGCSASPAWSPRSCCRPSPWVWGQLSVVETVITLEVPLTLLIASYAFSTRIGPSEWSGILVMTIGMIALVAALNPRPGTRRRHPHHLRPRRRGNRRDDRRTHTRCTTRPRVWRTACLGAATGTSFGLTATLIKENRGAESDHGILGVVVNLADLRRHSFGAVGIVLRQAALHLGPLLAAKPASRSWTHWCRLVGRARLQRTHPKRPWLVPATLGAVAIAVGVAMLTRSPLAHRPQRT